MSGRRRPDDRTRDAARAIFRECLGTVPRRVLAQPGGHTNVVYRVDAHDGSFVLKLSQDEAKLDDYRKEAWAIQCALDAGVPTPEVVQVSSTRDGLAYMLSRRSPGWLATKYGNSHQTLAQLGRIARALHETVMPAFGARFWKDHPPGHTWDAFVRQEWALEGRVDELRRLELVDDRQAARIAQTVRDLGTGRDARLNHGDLRLKNVLVDVEGRVTAVIDWETATAAPAPEWDLAVALHDLSIDQKDAFIDGYGLDEDELHSLGPVLAALNVLHYAPFATAAASEGDHALLQRYRRRFARLYDLYSIDRS